MRMILNKNNIAYIVVEYELVKGSFGTKMCTFILIIQEVY